MKSNQIPVIWQAQFDKACDIFGHDIVMSIFMNSDTSEDSYIGTEVDYQGEPHLSRSWFITSEGYCYYSAF